MKGSSHTIKVLHGYGANINIPENEGYSPFVFSARWGKMKAIEVLMELGANVTHATNDGSTGRDFAMKRGHFEIAAMIDRHQLRLQLRTFFMGTLRPRATVQRSIVTLLPVDILGLIANLVLKQSDDAFSPSPLVKFYC
eukprot:c17844_g1_i1.p1 GENE.c17844_g1_i1~~c17844_g1_i1.p1  ORF type:complete len:139 (+),score=28.53 c17844_g1_i1:606-1022(+)